MNPLKILIVDDEPLARLRLRGLVEAIHDQRGELRLEVVAEAATGTQAGAWLREHACDLVLLDVQMPGPDGLQFADSLRERPNTPLIIFVTAHPSHALQAFEVEALDFLTKPVRRERLQVALAKAAQRLSERQAAVTLRDAAEPASEGLEGEFVTLTERGRLVRVPLAEVLYFKADQKYVVVRTATESRLMDGSLSDLEARWPERFLRIHRNALVAKHAVRELERHALVAPADADPDSGDGWAVRIVHVDEWLLVSRRQVAAVREALKGQGG